MTSLKVKLIELDASGWTTTEDFYDALLSELGAPDWHGHSGVALVDTMFHSDVNKVVPPFRVEIRNSTNLPSIVKSDITDVINLFQAVRARRRERGADVDVSIALV